MSEKTRKKKDGHDKGKKNEAMHHAEHERREEGASQEHSPQSDQNDIIGYKQGAADDRTPRPVSPNISR
ncbi:MAG TPA: hypothetical protein VFW40_12485 [Capsulimonadaceae bacterium]|nr:hypothetical protein [Capsulimonadaceae bacterium]